MTPKSPKKNRGKTSLFPTTDQAKRIAAIMHRQDTTAWAEKEVIQFRHLSKLKSFDEEKLVLVERYYSRNWPPRRGQNILRTDLYTLLNNWAGELDRATVWNEAHPVKPAPRKVIPMPLISSEPMKPLSAEDQASADRFMEQYRQRKGQTV